jgi:zeaxanthin glucosyltransferase
LRIGIVSLPVSGHLNPMSALARKLQSRGHDIVLLSIPDTEPFVLAAGLKFVPVGEDAFPIGTLMEVERLFSIQDRWGGLEFTFNLMAQVTGRLLRPLASIVCREKIDALVFDTYQPYLELAALNLKIPYIHVSNAVHFDTSGATPLCFFDWPHEDTSEARARNLEGMARFRKLLEPSVAVAKEYASEVGLTVDWTDPAATISKLAWITQTPKQFDFSSSQWPAHFRHTGPFHDGFGRLDIPFPWERLIDAPLVYASMGTLQNGLERVFRMMIDAARTRQDLQFVIVVGNKLDPAQFSNRPDNVILVSSAPQLELLKRAALCITHAGLNTVLEALAQGVPLVAIPITNDQPGVAARIADKHVGEFVPFYQRTSDRLAALIDTVYGDPSYRENARHIQHAIVETDGLTLAAELIEEVLGLRKSQRSTSIGRSAD